MERSRASNSHLRLWAQSDNTVKDLRNWYGFRMHSSLVQSNVFSTSCEAHLAVGHTHEDVDGVLSLAKAALDGAADIQTPNDVMTALRLRLAPVFAKRGLDFEVEWITLNLQNINWKLRRLQRSWPKACQRVDRRWPKVGRVLE